jgi:hypothetical protein
MPDRSAWRLSRISRTSRSRARRRFERHQHDIVQVHPEDINPARLRDPNHGERDVPDSDHSADGIDAAEQAPCDGGAEQGDAPALAVVLLVEDASRRGRDIPDAEPSGGRPGQDRGGIDAVRPHHHGSVHGWRGCHRTRALLGYRRGIRCPQHGVDRDLPRPIHYPLCGRRTDNQEVGAHGLDALEHPALGALADGDHHDHRRHAHEETRHAERGAETMGG